MERHKTLAERIDLSQLRMLERKMLEHSDSRVLLLHILGAVIIVYGLWTNVIEWVLIGILFPIAGHIYIENKMRIAGRKK
ncbi:MAG: hypothetical protein V1886_02195 [archaeon]